MYKRVAIPRPLLYCTFTVIICTRSSPYVHAYRFSKKFRKNNFHLLFFQLNIYRFVRIHFLRETGKENTFQSDFTRTTKTNTNGYGKKMYRGNAIQRVV